MVSRSCGSLISISERLSVYFRNHDRNISAVVLYSPSIAPGEASPRILILGDEPQSPTKTTFRRLWTANWFPLSSVPARASKTYLCTISAERVPSNPNSAQPLHPPHNRYRQGQSELLFWPSCAQNGIQDFLTPQDLVFLHLNPPDPIGNICMQ